MDQRKVTVSMDAWKALLEAAQVITDDVLAGSAVRLKSGGPVMTVEKIVESYAYCAWFAGEDNREGCFSKSSLNVIPGENSECSDDGPLSCPCGDDDGLHCSLEGCPHPIDMSEDFGSSLKTGFILDQVLNMLREPDFDCLVIRCSGNAQMHTIVRELAESLSRRGDTAVCPPKRLDQIAACLRYGVSRHFEVIDSGSHKKPLPLYTIFDDFEMLREDNLLDLQELSGRGVMIAVTQGRVELEARRLRGKTAKRVVMVDAWLDRPFSRGRD